MLNEAAPVVRFTVSDVGSGFDTGDFDSHVDLYLVPIVDFGDTMMRSMLPRQARAAVRYMTVTFPQRVLMRKRLRCSSGLGGTGALTRPSNARRAATLRAFLAQTANIGDNGHGVAFGIRIVAQDVAGNEQRSLTKLTIDGQAPLLVAAGSHTGRVWNVDKGVEEKAANGIRIKFNESLDIGHG